jgi:hypothetical protein
MKNFGGGGGERNMLFIKMQKIRLAIVQEHGMKLNKIVVPMEHI